MNDNAMRNFGNGLEFIEERNKDLMRAYRQALGEAKRIYLPEIFAKTARMPSARFWVSERRAANVIAALEDGRQVQMIVAGKREMYEEIYRRYLALRETRRDASVLELASEIVYQPAPSFYMTARSVGEIIRRIKNGHYDRKGNIKDTD